MPRLAVLALLLVGALPEALVDLYTELDAEIRVVAAAESRAGRLATAAAAAARDLAKSEGSIRGVDSLRLEVEARRLLAEGDKASAQRRLGLLLDDLVSTAHPRWLSLLVGGSHPGPTRETVRAAQQAVANQDTLIARLAADLDNLSVRAANATTRRDQATRDLATAEEAAAAAGRELAATRTAS
ncbi:hypothetical protein IIA16_06825, partial [bacterium]|nr:hypothetical protein [bacterium]